jgi:Tfp pilus assembly protein PilV
MMSNVFSLSHQRGNFTLLEVILAMLILAGALTALLGERQRSLQHSRQGIERQFALRLASSLLDQEELGFGENSLLTYPEEYHVDIVSNNFSNPILPSTAMLDITLTVTTPSGDKVQLSRVINP